MTRGSLDGSGRISAAAGVWVHIPTKVEQGWPPSESLPSPHTHRKLWPFFRNLSETKKLLSDSRTVRSHLSLNHKQMRREHVKAMSLFMDGFIIAFLKTILKGGAQSITYIQVC